MNLLNFKKEKIRENTERIGLIQEHNILNQILIILICRVTLAEQALCQIQNRPTRIITHRLIVNLRLIQQSIQMSSLLSLRQLAPFPLRQICRAQAKRLLEGLLIPRVLGLLRICVPLS